MRQELKYTDIFVPGGFPWHTYNPRGSQRLEERLRQVFENLCKLAVVTGHTKSGKTVLAKHVLPPEKCIWIDGGAIGEEDDLWDEVVGQLDLFQTKEISEKSDMTGTATGKAAIEGSAIIAKASGEISGSVATTTGSTEVAKRSVSSRTAALAGLRAGRKALVIDDFHYLSKDLQGTVVRALKALIFDGIPVGIIAIPHRRYDAMKVEKEMTGRIEPITIPVWELQELRFIPEIGFPKLGYRLAENVIDRFAAESIGSPHLMQDFCRTLCRRRDLKQASDTLLEAGDAEVESVFRDVADTIGRPIFEKLARGPQQRSDRIQRKLKLGEIVDIYSLVLHALARLRPGLVTLEYEDLRSAIKDVCETEVPQLHEVVRVLKHMAAISASDQSSTPVIDFEQEEKKLHITDPFFAFYLRWGDLNIQNT